jgi:MFS family permease
VNGGLARRAVLGALVCQMGLGLGGYVLAAFLRPIVAELGWSRAAFSVSTLPFLLGMSLASPLVGAMTDRIGPRRVFAAGIVVVAVALGGLSGMQTLTQFYAWGFVLGLGVTGLGDIPAGTVVTRHVRGHGGLALGIAYIGSNIGGALVPLIAAAVTEAASWRVALQVLAALGLVVILPAALWIVPDGRGPDDRDAAADAGEPPGRTLAEARGTRAFWVLGAVLFSFYFYYVGINHHLIAYLTDEGFTDAAAARRFSFVVAIGIAGKLGIGAIADRVGLRRAVLLTFGILTAASWLLLILGDVPTLLPVYLVAHGFTVAAENVLLPLAVTACFGPRHLPAIYGALMLALLPGGVLGPYLSGLSFDRLGTYQPAFTAFAVGNLLAFLALMTLPLGAGAEARRSGQSAGRARGPGGGP